jgi:hypothetical protein
VDEIVERALSGMRADFGDDRRAWRAATDPYVPSPRAPGEFSVRPSDVDGCGRQVWYRNFRPELGTDPSFKGEADAGQMVEGLFVTVRQDRYPWRQYQREVRIPGVDSVGKIDEYDPVTGSVVEVKSAGRATWDYVQTHGPRPGHKGQAHLYGLALEAEGKPPARIDVIYVNRDNLRTVIFSYPWDDRARTVAAAAQDELLGLLTALEVSTLTGEPLERDRSGPSSDEICRRCPFRTACWNLDVAARHGRSGESVTILGVSPDDEKVAWAIGQVVAANGLRNEADKHAKATKPLIDGLPPGVYVGQGGPDDLWEIAPGHKGREDWKAYAEALVLAVEAGRDYATVQVPRYGETSAVARRASQDKRKRALKAAQAQPACRDAAETTEDVA